MTDSNINPSLFRAYDIRGVYGTDLTEDVMERVGNGFGNGFVKDAAVVGMDGRVSSPGLKKAFIDGVLKAGLDVIDVGLVPRGVCLFWAWKVKKPSAYITASHLPKEWNGIKFAYDNGVEFLEEDNRKIGEVVLKGRYKSAPSPGKTKTEDVIDNYKKFILSKIGRVARPLRVVVDCGNGTGGLVAPELFSQLGFSVKTLFKDVDGDSPKRPWVVEDSALSELKKRVREADFGVAYDGDSDRMSLVDEHGRVLGPEVASYIILQDLVKSEPGPIIANVECLKIMDEIAKRNGRQIHRVRVGNSFLVQAVLEKHACFGVERSGHFCIPSIIPMDDGIAASLYAACALARTGKKLSQIVDALPLYPFKRIKVDCADELKFGVIERVKKRLSAEYANVNTIDGVRVDFDYGWVLIRASNTGPVIRLSVEADDARKLLELGEKFLKILREETEKSK